MRKDVKGLDSGIHLRGGDDQKGQIKYLPLLVES